MIICYKCVNFLFYKFVVFLICLLHEESSTFFIENPSQVICIFDKDSIIFHN